MINTDLEIRFGSPCIVGTRIAVADILGYLAGGDDANTIVANFPELKLQDVRDAIRYAANAINGTIETITSIKYVENINR